jgi:hypothetical protein
MNGQNLFGILYKLNFHQVFVDFILFSSFGYHSLRSFRYGISYNSVDDFCDNYRSDDRLLYNKLSPRRKKITSNE